MVKSKTLLCFWWVCALLQPFEGQFGEIYLSSLTMCVAIDSNSSFSWFLEKRMPKGAHAEVLAVTFLITHLLYNH